MMNTDKIKSASPHVLPSLPYADYALDPVILIPLSRTSSIGISPIPTWDR